MRKLVAAMFVLVVLSVFVGVPGARAIPLGTFNRYAITQWQGNTEGAATETAISNPGLSGTNADWNRHMKLLDSSGDYMDMGFEKFNTPRGAYYCNNYNPGLYMYIWPSGNAGATCFSVPNGDINQYGFLTIWNDSSTGDTEFEAIGFPVDFGCQPNPCSVVEHGHFPLWNKIYLGEGIRNTFTGHNVWGVSWSYNQWLDSHDVWHYQNRPAPGTCPNDNGCVVFGPGNPPQMYWKEYPANDSTGGILFSCDYNTGTICFLGG